LVNQITQGSRAGGTAQVLLASKKFLRAGETLFIQQDILVLKKTGNTICAIWADLAARFFCFLFETIKSTIRGVDLKKYRVSSLPNGSFFRLPH
jgi:hypothetical protein